jgi:hypothetical protein
VGRGDNTYCAQENDDSPRSAEKNAGTEGRRRDKQAQSFLVGYSTQCLELFENKRDRIRHNSEADQHERYCGCSVYGSDNVRKEGTACQQDQARSDRN